MLVKLTALVAALIAAGFIGVLLDRYVASRVGSVIAVQELSVIRDPENIRRVVADLTLKNVSHGAFQVMGISRADCGYRSVSLDAPFHLEQDGERQVKIELEFGNPFESYAVPIVVYTNHAPFVHGYELCKPTPESMRCGPQPYPVC